MGELTTMFAPPERVEQSVVLQQLRSLPSLAHDFLNAVPSVFLILNEQRQIVFANQALLDVLELPDAETVIGMRPGEVLGCVHANTNAAGCGTAEACRTCGAIQAVLMSLQGKKTVVDSRITRRDGTPLDLRITGSPFWSNGQLFSLVALVDISHEKRRQVFERLFFHDVLNLAGVLLGYTELLNDLPVEEARVDRIVPILRQAAVRLVDEIKSQRELSAAEAGELSAHPIVLRSRQVLRGVVSFYEGHEAASQRALVIHEGAEDVMFQSDPVLLERVLGNLIKNALEASEPGQTVTVNCGGDEERVWFSVRNETVMPRNVQLQMFQRSFSTKGKGHGLGTYSVKLFTERYLRGTVGFESAPEVGTLFKVIYPLALET